MSSGSNERLREALEPGASLPIIVTDLGYGDAGKGTMIDWLARETEAVAVVRYNGGPQAGHNVVLQNGTHHEFAQFGAATFVHGVRTHLSRYMMVSPLNIFAEEAHLRRIGIASAFERLSIDADALIITPFQRAANRLKELERGDARHGSCGQGVGETMSDFLRHGDAVVFARDLDRPDVLRSKLRFLQAMKREEVGGKRTGIYKESAVLYGDDSIENFMQACADLARQASIVDRSYLGKLLEEGTVLFEGAQGILLDEWYGFHPYTTWSTTTPKNARSLLAEQGVSDAYTLGVTRAYATRHGAGPFVTEDPELNLPEPHNVTNDWQHGFRQGHLDIPALRYALEVAGKVDGIALTCLDKLDVAFLCLGYDYRGALPDLHPYFDKGVFGDKIVRMRPGSIANHAHNEALANRVKDCRPIYASGVETEEMLADALDSHLGHHVVVESWGPTYADKRVRSTVSV